MCLTFSFIEFVKGVILYIFLTQSMIFWLRTKTYLTDDAEIAAIATKYAQTGQGVEFSYSKIKTELRKRFPGHILSEEDEQWMFMNARSWKGKMCILHASLSEYILLFGTDVDIVSFFGRYWANTSYTILTGSCRQWKFGQLSSKVFAPDIYCHCNQIGTLVGKRPKKLSSNAKKYLRNCFPHLGRSFPVRIGSWHVDGGIWPRIHPLHIWFCLSGQIHHRLFDTVLHITCI
ncbi:sigma non-opioid intracellular receptor 1-like isoform X1 [Mizuhopecten yessoensis]|uniref:sigma non-opioid intracellular receptor 1-like isoform X1 n=1 Tax=Mizuhopecten yessoensis TaxID=6573 RepID=UPI000B45CBE4|nr:sigma non-opioid intracellular receptor 1-like isoform X1 [Mizuhopecten yessoensis]